MLNFSYRDSVTSFFKLNISAKSKEYSKILQHLKTETIEVGIHTKTVVESLVN